ncbi:hypothetical protein EC957_010489 [Mortierella hygrophila]|uniref:Uncharacterized protein n=1 Tax=Mortierella hygrophila TaxID=979708 RepID=A0A9P6JXC6_9FUNG|nr:hypothetical protein EC957_010489 [Mortierella hygrophila]
MHLERQGLQIVRAKERSDTVAEKTQLSDGRIAPPERSPLPKLRTFQNSMTLTPSKKRSWATGTM